MNPAHLLRIPTNSEGAFKVKEYMIEDCTLRISNVLVPSMDLQQSDPVDGFYGEGKLNL